MAPHHLWKQKAQKSEFNMVPEIASDENSFLDESNVINVPSNTIQSDSSYHFGQQNSTLDQTKIVDSTSNAKQVDDSPYLWICSVKLDVDNLNSVDFLDPELGDGFDRQYSGAEKVLFSHVRNIF